MVQVLKLAEDLFKGLEEGWKKVTIRHGKRHIDLDHLKFEGTNNSVLTKAVLVTKVSYTRAKHLSDEDAQKDGADNAVELLESMKRFYPNIQPNDILTIIEFTQQQ